MELNSAIDILKEYVHLDRDVRKGSGHNNNFDDFCEEKCIAIETIINFIGRCDKCDKRSN